MVNYICSILLLTFSVNAFCCDYPSKIEVGELSNCSGYIITEDQLVKSGKAIRDSRLKDLKISDLEATTELYDMRHTNYRVELQKTKNDLSQLQFTSKLGYVISFGLGVALTTVIVRGLK